MAILRARRAAAKRDAIGYGRDGLSWGRRMMRIFVMALALGFVAGSVPAAARDACGALRAPASTRAADAALVTRIGRQKVSAKQVGYALSEGSWRLVWATPSDAERGVFYFRRAGKGYRLVDTWGGVIPPDERNETIAWAHARAGHPSRRLSACFVDAVIAGK